MKLNRTIAPEFKLPEKISLPNVTDICLQNGLQLSVMNTCAEDVLRFSIVFGAGTRYQPQLLVAAATLNMLAEGTQKYTSNEIADLLDFYGSAVEVEIDRDWSYVTFYSLTKHFEKTMEIAEQIIKYPTFSNDEIEIYTQNQKQHLILEREKISVKAREAFTSALYGAEHHYGCFAKPDDYDKIDRELLKNFHQKYYSSNNAFVVVSGKVSEREINIISDFFGNEIWGSGEKATPEQKKIITSTEKIICIPKKDSLQSAIRIGRVMFEKKHDDYCGMIFLNTILGGYFGSRLMKNIREEKGYTYGIYSNIVCMRDSGYFTISAEVGSEYVNPTLDEIKKEILRLREEKISKEELSLVQNYIVGDMLRSIDGAWKIADVYIDVKQMGVGFEYVEHMLDEVLKITPNRICDLANKYLDIDKLINVIAGRC